MSLGKAAKQKRNIDAKIAKREAKEKEEFDKINCLNNNTVYLIDFGYGSIMMLGREIKEMNNIEIK